MTSWWRRLLSTSREAVSDDPDLLRITAREAAGPPASTLRLLTIADQQLEGEDYSDRKLDSLSVSYSRLVRCRFERLRVESVGLGGGLSPTEFVECSFDGSRFESGDWGVSRFIRCSFRGVRLKRLIGYHAEFIDCVFSGNGEELIFFGSPTGVTQSLEELKALNAGMPGFGDGSEWQRRVQAAEQATGQDRFDREINRFTGNDFREMELIDTAFRRGIDLTKQRFREDAEHALLRDPQAAIVEARAVVRFWEDDEARNDALATLRVLEEELAGGQEQLFVRAKDLESDPGGGELFELLVGVRPE